MNKGQQLLKKAQLKNINEESLLKKSDLQEINLLDIQPKQKAKLLLSNIKDTLFPLEKELRTKLSSLLAAHQTQSLSLSFDKKLEQQSITVQAQVSSSRDLQELTKKLSSLPIDRWREVFEGLDV